MSTLAAARAHHTLATLSAVDVCSFVDDLPAGATGEIVFAGDEGGPRDGPIGAVFVESGRVCWAAARGLARRLSDLLAASARLESSEMEAHYRHCKRVGAPLGEHLVSAGIVTAEGLRGALLRHTAESLSVLCAPGHAARWISRRRSGYSPRFTFRTPELLSHLFASGHEDVAHEAAAELADAFADRGWGAAFLRSTRAAPDPIAVYGQTPDRVDAVLRLGVWAVSTLDVTTLLNDESAFVATVLDDDALVAWKWNATIIAGWTNVYGPARLLNRRSSMKLRKVAPHADL
jgi:hypothetical protein